MIAVITYLADEARGNAMTEAAQPDELDRPDGAFETLLLESCTTFR